MSEMAMSTVVAITEHNKEPLVLALTLFFCTPLPFPTKYIGYLCSRISVTG